MPIPKPQDNETQEDFIARAHEAMAGDYPDRDQRHAIIMEQWREMRGGEKPQESKSSEFQLKHSSNTKFQTPKQERAILEAAFKSFQVGDLSEPKFLSILFQVTGSSDNPLYVEFYDRARELGLFTEPSTFTELQNVEIFRSGQHTDSLGVTREFSHDDLQQVLRNFQDKKVSNVPVKLGHTSTEFTDRIAKALEIPLEVLTGDSKDNFHGRARLGEVVSLSANGVLKATIQFSNDKVAKLIQDKYFTDVSAELLRRPGPDGKDEIILSGLALLGGERPAVKGLAGLQTATMLDDGTLPNEIYMTPAKEVFALKDPGATELVWDVPLQEQESGKTVSVIHHRAPTAETALSEIVHAVGAGLREFAVVLGRGGGGIAVLLLGRRYLFGRPAIAKKALPVDSTADILTKVRDVLGRGISSGAATPTAGYAPGSGGAFGRLLRSMGGGTPGVPGMSFVSPLGEEFLELAVRRVTEDKMQPLLQVFQAMEKQPTVSKFAGLLPETAMNRITRIWSSVEKGQISREAGVEQIGKIIQQVQGLVSDEDFAKLLQAFEVIRAGFLGRSPEEAREKAAALRFLGQELEGGSMDTWVLSYVVNGEAKSEDVQAASEQEAKAKAPEGATDITATKKEAPASEMPMMSEVGRALGLTGRFSSRDVLRSITNLQSHVAKFSENEFRGLQEKVKVLHRRDRISTYQEATSTLSLIKGTPQELAIKLVNLEERTDEKTAKEMLTIWQETQHQAEVSGAMSTVLNARHYEEDNSDLETAVSKYMEANSRANRGEAYKAVMLANPKLRSTNGKK